MGVAEDRLAITSVTVVDVTDGSIRPDQTALVDGAQNHMTFLPARGDLPVAATLGAYEGDYRGLDFQGGEDLIRLYLDDGRLFMTRPNGRPLIGGILPLGMLRDPAGGFFVEVLNGRVEFEARPTSEVSGLTYPRLRNSTPTSGRRCAMKRCGDRHG